MFLIFSLSINNVEKYKDELDEFISDVDIFKYIP